MRIRNLWAAATLCGGIITFGIAQATVLRISKWPDDVPCTAISKNPDGSYTLRTSITLSDGGMIASGFTVPTTGEYQVWATKCGAGTAPDARVPPNSRHERERHGHYEHGR